jgi:hypothetical protein
VRDLLLAAVADAINYLEDDRVFCPDCRNSQGALCLEHQEAANLAARYTEIHAQLREADWSGVSISLGDDGLYRDEPQGAVA